VPHVVSAAPVLAPHRYEQAEITAVFGRVVGLEPERQALPLDRYPTMSGFGEANDAFIDVGLDLAELAVKEGLARAGLSAEDVDVIMTVSVTGVAAPSLDARLVRRLGLRPDVRRVPVFGLGCVAGAAGVARMADLLAGRPDSVGVLLSVELCSLTVQRADVSMANLVASGLFGDGAAAVVMVGDRRAEQVSLPTARVVDSMASLYPDTEDVMGWQVSEKGFRVVLSPRVPEMVRTYLGRDVESFLGRRGESVEDVDRFVAHPGGPKVLEAMAETLGQSDDAFAVTWSSLRAVGNLSSASVLHVLSETLDDSPSRGERALMMAMGPGFCSEQVLLEW